jgi:hypothetical protein
MLGNSPVWEEENCLSSATHPLWPRILEHVYKKAMRDLLIVPVRLHITLTMGAKMRGWQKASYTTI